MSELLAVTLNMIPPDQSGACTLWVHHGEDIWRKTYRSRDAAEIDTRSMGILTSTFHVPLALAMDLDDLRRLGFSR